MDSVAKHIETGFIVAGVGLGIAQIEQIMGIILLAFQILLILFRVGLRIYKHIKDGDLEKASDEAQKGADDIGNLRKKDDGKKN